MLSPEEQESLLKTLPPKKQAFVEEKIRTLLREGFLVHPTLATVAFGYGSFLPRVAEKNPDLLTERAFSLLQEGEKGIRTLWEEGKEKISLPLPQKLRRMKNRGFLLVLLGQILKVSSVDNLLFFYSLFADELLSSGLTHSIERMEEKWGPLLGPGGEPLPIVVFGCGKLGSNELNLSSDVDLIVVVGDGAETKGALSPSEYIHRLLAEYIRLLTQMDEEGFIFRVDLRLRPGGGRSPLYISASSFLDYYRLYSTVWEKFALFRARPVAGDLTLGSTLLKELEDVLFPPYLDFDLLEDMRYLKGKIDREAVRGKEKERDIKLGPGGIRELEFLLHTLAIIYGGKTEKIRKKETIPLITSLKEEGIVPEEVAESLKEGYRFLREVENLIQGRENRQTHLLPTDEGLKEIAWGMGYGGENETEMFLTHLKRHREVIHREFSSLFGGKEPSPASPELMDLIEGWEENDPEERKKVLQSLGFADPEKAVENLQRLKEGPRPTLYGERVRVQFEKILPSLLSEILHTPDPDSALRRLKGFIEKVGGRSYIYALMREKPSVLKGLVEVFSTSELLSRYILLHPELLDFFVLRTHTIPYRPEKEIQNLLEETFTGNHSHPWEIGEELRKKVNEEVIRIAFHDLNGALTLKEVSEQLTTLAETTVRIVLKLAKSLLPHPLPPTPLLLPLALGKLGSKEMMYRSDLDLIFLIHPSYKGEVDLPIRLAQKTITLLTTRTQNGFLYEVDMRLRPSGNQGLLVSTFPAFKEYHRKRASIWERVAMVYFRPLEELPEEVEEFLHNAIFGKPLTPEELNEMVRIRKKMEIERGEKEPFKAGRGGVASVEIGIALLTLYGAKTRGVQPNPNPFHLLEELKKAFPELNTTLENFTRSLYFYRLLLNRIRLITDRSLSDFPQNPRDTKAVIHSLGWEVEETKSLYEEISRITLEGWERVIGFLRGEIGG